MLHSKLIEVFRSFSKVELTRIEKLIHSPIHNQHEGVHRLFEYLSKKKQFSEQNVSKTALFQAAFPSEPFDTLRLRHVCSYLTKCLDDYLVLMELEQDDFQKKQLLLTAYRKKRLDKWHRQSLNSMGAAIQKEKIRDADHYYRQFKYEQVRFSVLDSRTPEVYEPLQKMSENFEIFTVIHTLKTACSMITHHKMFSQEYTQHLLESVLEKIEQQELHTYPTVAIYLSCYNLLHLIEEDANFQKLKAQLEEFEPLFHTLEIRSLYLIAINFCIGKINTGNPAYLREVFSLYRTSLDSKVLLEEGQLSQWTYKNILSAALKLAEFEWAESFIIQFQPHLPEKYQGSFFHYNRARLFFAKKEFRSATEILNQVYLKDIFTEIDARLMLIKANYELGELALMEHALENLNQFIRRRKLNTYHRMNYQNFIRFARKLLNLQTLDDRGRKEIHHEIRAAEQVIEKEWLLEKSL